MVALLPDQPKENWEMDGEHPEFADLVDGGILTSLEEKGLSLRDHQKEGVARILKWKQSGHGGILADEMGLGKTCQSAIVLWQLYLEGGGPFIVICPFSVIGHFAAEIKRFTCGVIEAVTHYGYQDVRKENFSSRDWKLERNQALVIPYHLAIADLKDLSIVHRNTPFTALILDEAQRSKNSLTNLYATLTHLQPLWMLLMTGTPIQNNLSELYTLLTLCDPTRFLIKDVEEFGERHLNLEHVDELKALMSTYTLRRTKEEIFKNEIPPYDQVILYHGLSELQKDLYMKYVRKDHLGLLQMANNKSNRLISLFLELRKLVFHPYLFRGIEPEPYTEGEHLVHTSGKLQMLDRLLKYLNQVGHRCLIFSQYVMTLDIVEDYLRMRDYSFERIDGRVQVEERFAAIERFHDPSKPGPFLFLLTSRAGGVGLNLTGADTVVFMDTDWNPQSDLQAMARCHRIGQTKPVRVIRLVARYTVEQYMLLKARRKLKLTEAVMDEKENNLSSVALQSILRRGMQGLGQQSQDEDPGVGMSDGALEKIIGKTENGVWMPLEEEDADADKKDAELFEVGMERIGDVDGTNNADVNVENCMIFRGTDYRTQQAKTRLELEMDIINEAENPRQLRPRTTHVTKETIQALLNEDEDIDYFAQEGDQDQGEDSDEPRRKRAKVKKDKKRKSVTKKIQDNVEKEGENKKNDEDAKENKGDKADESVKTEEVEVADVKEELE